MLRLTLPAALFAAGILASPAICAEQGSIRIEDAWSRAALPGRVGVIYMTITDTGAPDRLTGAESPVAQRAELHESMSDQGVMKMRPVAALPVAPGKPVSLAPGGYHIMLINLKHALKEGDSVPVTLTFEKAGKVTATATVRKAGAPAPHGR